MPVLDLDYAEDSGCDTDMNVVMNDGGGFIEMQGTAEGHAFRREELDALLALAEKGIAELLRRGSARRWPRREPCQVRARRSASGNPGKLAEFTRLLAGTGIEIVAQASSASTMPKRPAVRSSKMRCSRPATPHAPAACPRWLMIPACVSMRSTVRRDCIRRATPAGTATTPRTIAQLLRELTVCRMRNAARSPSACSCCCAMPTTRRR